MGEFAAIGVEAGALDAVTVSAIGSIERIAALEQLQERMARVLEATAAVSSRAQEQGFDDIARQADAIRQQVQAARNKLTLFHARTIKGA